MQTLELPDDDSLDGVVIASIALGFVADRACLTDACLESGDLLHEINGRPIGMEGDAHCRAAGWLREAEGRVELRVSRINARPKDGHITDWLMLSPSVRAAPAGGVPSPSVDDNAVAAPSVDDDADESNRESFYEPSDRMSIAMAETATRDKTYSWRASIGLSGVVSTNV